MSLSKKVKGAIYRFDIYDEPRYFRGYHKGMTKHKSEAYVYTKEEIAEYNLKLQWAPKCDGTWVLVYE